ncbi:alpha/beta fold hydrolase [Alloscardovia omnicolens]|uniref:alpha/beta fold hydrolase n=1 Tax=Alloscardovia omnicolens TaxID=419015 RepID=UPI003A77B7E9
MQYGYENVEGVNVFYRETDKKDLPTLVLFHGFPSASHMYRNLIPILENDFYCIAMDYPGFGQSDMPSRDNFEYTFEHLAQICEQFLLQRVITRFFMYVFDYGAPIGFRIAERHPEWISGIISQNGNVYREGLGPKWAAREEYWNNPTPELREQYKSAFSRETVISQYTFGTQPGSVAPDGYELDLHYAEKPEYAEIQSDLIFDYQTNVALYPRFQAYLREYQPPLLAVWGKNDPSFIWAGAQAFAQDLPHAIIKPMNSGHFALESCCQEIADEILKFKHTVLN